MCHLVPYMSVDDTTSSKMAHDIVSNIRDSQLNLRLRFVPAQLTVRHNNLLTNVWCIRLKRVVRPILTLQMLVVELHR